MSSSTIISLVISCLPLRNRATPTHKHLPVSKEDLGRAIFQRATEGTELLLWTHVRCTAKVYELDVEELVDDDVLVLRKEGGRAGEGERYKVGGSGCASRSVCG